MKRSGLRGPWCVCSHPKASHTRRGCITGCWCDGYVQAPPDPAREESSANEWYRLHPEAFDQPPTTWRYTEEPPPPVVTDTEEAPSSEPVLGARPKPAPGVEAGVSVSTPVPPPGHAREEDLIL